MIEKILQIKSVGRFREYQAHGDVRFGKLSLIYGSNASGKSTLAAILRSLQRNAPEYLEERRTLGSHVTPLVRIRTADATITYQEGRWSTNSVKLELFDETFVVENVYSGQTVEPGHRLNLHRFAIGDQAVSAAKQLEDLSRKINAMNTELRQLREQIQRHIEGSMDVDEFVNLQQVDHLDQEIANSEQMLRSLRGIQGILNAPVFEHVTLPSLPLDEVAAVLATTLTDLSAGAESEVMAHIRRCMDRRGESWIAQGMEYIRDDRCPFCGQSLNGVRLIEAYKTYFSIAYSEFKRHVAAAGEMVDSSISEPHLSGLRTAVVENARLLDFWRQHLDVHLPRLSPEEVTRVLADLREYLNDLVKRKSQAPLEPVGLRFDEMSPVARYREIEQQVRDYNAAVDRANAAILKKKHELQGVPVAIVEERLRVLRNTRARFSHEVDKLCRQYRTAIEEKNKLEDAKEEARRSLEILSEQLLRNYGSTMNGLLARFGASFRLAGVRETYYGGIPRVDYELEVSGYRVALEETGRGSPQPCFRNTLSSGDRTTLAFSFFLARMDADPALADKVIVLDDPLSSLDANRQTQTVQEIVRLAQRCRQLVLLSHNRPFLVQVWKAARGVSLDTRGLYLRRRGEDTVIELWDIESEARRPPLQEFFVLKEYLEGSGSGELNTIARCIRPLLENSLRLRFPDEFTMDDTLGDMIAKIRKARDPSSLVGLQSRLQELEDIDAYACRFHHGMAGLRVETTDEELRSFARRALQFHQAVEELG